LSNKTAKQFDNLNDLKEKLWLKIQALDHKLQVVDEKSDDYRKVIDAYHKIVKCFVDIVKVQYYSPGALSQDKNDESLASLLSKLKARSALEAADKVALQQFKEFLDYAKKVPIGLQRKKTR
jgi:chromosome segregation ATPase